MELAMLCALCSCGLQSSAGGESSSPVEPAAAANTPQENTTANNPIASSPPPPQPAAGPAAAAANNCNNQSQLHSPSANNGPSIGPPTNNNLPMPATKEDIRQWRCSFDLLMSTRRGQDCFRQFLRSEYSEENMLFWLSVEDLKALRDNAAILDRCKAIYEDYISVLSPKEVSIDSRIREVVNRKMMEPDTRTFDEAQTQIYQLMKRDSYHRFINSSFFKSLEHAAAAAVPPTSGGGKTK